MEAVPELVVPELLPPGGPGRRHRARRQQARRERGQRADRDRRALRRRRRLGGRRRSRRSCSARPSTAACCSSACRSATRCTRRAARSGSARSDDITWGAFQAYGDPGWRAEPRDPGAHAGSEGRAVRVARGTARCAGQPARRPVARGRQTERETARHGASDRAADHRSLPARVAGAAGAAVGPRRRVARPRTRRGRARRPPAAAPCAGQDVEAAPPIAAIACKRGKGRQRTLAQQSAGLQFGAAHEQRGQARRGCAGRPIFRAGARRVG